MNPLAALFPPRFMRLLAGDALSIARDPMLLIAIVMSLAPALLFYLTQPAMDEAGKAALGIVAVSRYVAPVALLIPAGLIGWVTGFLLLEDRDEGTLLALDVTPVGKTGFLLYRTAITALVTIVITLAAWPLVIPDQPLGVALLLAILIAMDAIAAAVILPALARNKVEGLALTKLTNLASIVPLLAIIPSPLRYLGGIVPSYWIGEVLQLSPTASLPWPVVAVLALMAHAVAVWGLFALFQRRSG